MPGVSIKSRQIDDFGGSLSRCSLVDLVWQPYFSGLRRFCDRTALRCSIGWWTRLGHALAWFNTRVILTLIFMIVITPFSFVMWVFGRDRMKRGFDPKVETYRVPSPPRPPQAMEKPF
jgi:hypothetical protein